MKNNHTLHFKCLSCDHHIDFSPFDLDQNTFLVCKGCGKEYAFNDPAFIRQLKKFDALCRQIRESEEILGSASVGVDVGEHHVKVPYKLLLTRLSSVLELNIGGKVVSIVFRVEPTKEATSALTHVC